MNSASEVARGPINSDEENTVDTVQNEFRNLTPQDGSKIFIAVAPSGSSKTKGRMVKAARGGREDCLKLSSEL